MNGDDSDIIVAERNGEICGMVCVDYVNKPETPFSHARNFYRVQEIAVDVNHRRKGVAKELHTPSQYLGRLAEIQILFEWEGYL